MSRRLLVVAAMLLLQPALFSTRAATESGDRFKLISADDVAQLQRRLDAAGDRGYALIDAGQGAGVDGRTRVVVLLEREASAPGVHGYAVLGSDGDLSDPALEQRIDRHAAEGYRLAPRGVVIQRRPEFWLPESEYEDRVVLILHRAPGASAVQRYSWLSYGTPERFAREVTRLRVEGHEVLGMANTGHKLAFLISRQDEPQSSLAHDIRDDDFRLLLLATRKILTIHLGRAVGDGYRVRDACDPSVTGPPILLLERTALSGGPIEYRFLDDVPHKLRNGKLEHKLNKKAGKGWRVAPGGVTEEVLTLQRSKGWKTATRADYRLIASTSPEGISAGIEQALDEGYVYVDLLIGAAASSVLLSSSDDTGSGRTSLRAIAGAARPADAGDGGARKQDL